MSPFTSSGWRGKRRPMAYAIHLLFIGSALALGHSAPALAQDANTTAQQNVQEFHVAAGDLAAALRQIASQAGVLLSFTPGQTQGKTSVGLNGRYSVQEALSGVLRGTGLSAERSSNGSYVVRTVSTESGSGASSALPAVTVTAQTDAAEGRAYVSAAPLSTATPLGLSLKETPQSVSVMTRQRMEDQGLTTIQQVMAQTPGITMFSLGSERSGFTSRGYAITNYQIDGVNSHSENLGLDALPAQSLADMALYERVEILRGASGLMTGAGDASGAINMVRKKPAAEFQASAELQLGAWNQRRGVVDVSSPLNQAGNVRGRVVAVAQDGDSYIDSYSRNKQVLYGVVEADIVAGTKLTAGVEYQRNKSKGSMSYLGVPLFFSNGDMTDLPRSFNPGADANRFSSISTNLFATLEQRLANDWKLKVSASQLRSSQDERSVYLGVSDGFADKATGNGLKLNANQRSYDLNINTIDINVRGPFSLFGRQHELVFGMDYNDFDSKTDGSFDWGIMGTPVNLYNWNRSITPVFSGSYVTYDSTRSQASVYGAGRFAITDRLKLIAGAKVMRYNENYVSNAPTVNYYSAAPASESRVVTPYGGLVYDINDVHTVYASYSTIYQPQAAQDRNGALLPPREGTNYEIGIKSGWLDGRLNTAVALYQIHQKNLSESDPGYTVPGTTMAASRTVKGADTQGIDVEVNGALTPNWNIAASWAYSQTQNNQGNLIQTTFPRHLIKLWSTYRLPGEFSRLTVGGGVNWQSKVYSTVSAWQVGRDMYWEQKAYAVANLMARYDFNDKLSATLNVNNLFDKKYIASVSDWWYSAMYGTPRNVTLNMKYQF
ncbi:TonB-dependent siderophore receptor [Herbaspirillum autotrophicum]|uniref:TonB-dependent siderophore receptor n=1 Tax=Herbaspirillum autotrophicum TaxID=180195 RepID=UPI00067C0F02|nr:TonB-dependent receptor [Herbaspirillum autotrophicum]